MLKVDEVASVIAENKMSACIRVESTAPTFPEQFEELRSVAAKNRALGYAAEHGIADPRLNDLTIQVLPVNCEGLVLDQVKDEQGNPLPATHPRMQPANYYINVRVVPSLIR